MKVMTRGGKPITYLSKVVTTNANCCGNCGNTANTGACCTNNVCTVVTHERCTAHGGTYLGNLVPCMGVNCRSTTGACCHANGACSVETRTGCSAINGAYIGDGTNCLENHCVDLTLGCCVCPDEPNLCSTTIVSDCVLPCLWTQNTYCADNGTGTDEFCCLLNPVATACPGNFDGGCDNFCCEQFPNPHTCCGCFCVDIVTELCCSFVDPESFITFYYVCDSATEECCDADGCCPIGLCVDGVCTA